MKCILTAIFPLLISSCAMAPSVRQPLLDQEIRVRKQGFTNQVCLKRKFDGSCEQMDVMVYDLGIKEDRDRLREVKLICNVAGRRYHLCADEPCIFTQHEEVKRFLGIVTKRWMVIDDKIYMPAQLQELIDKKTYCAPQGSVSEGEMQWN